MANPVTYNSGSNPTGALKFGTMSMSVATSLNITGYNWRNGFENNNIWVIYSDTFSQGQSTQGNSVPTIWGTPIFTEAGLLTMINVLPARAGQTAFTTLSSAISWLVGEGKYFISNQNYPQTPVTDLCFFVDAGFTASFPNLGTVWYDLSGGGRNLTLTNGPSWNSAVTKSNFTMDGTDDNLVRNSSIMTSTTGTVVMWLRTSDTRWLWIRGNNTNAFFLGATDSSSWYNANCGSPNFFVDTAASTNPVTEGVLDGRFHMFEAKNVDLSSWTNYEILSYPGFEFSGNVSKILMYNRSISSDESAILYYQGDIVTSNLSYLWDASNIVSFQSGNSTTFDLKRSGINGTLQNGVGYSNNFSGYWSFDGADDRIVLTSSITPGNGNWTFNAWVRGNGSVIGNTSGGPVASSFGILSSKIFYANYSGVWNEHYGNTTLNPGEWYMLTWVNYSDGSGTMKMYVNGVADSSVFSSYTTNGGPLDVIGFGQYAMGSFTGSVGAVQFNSGKSFTDSEVNQQYGATEGRFKSFAAYANGGTVTTISQNGVNYRVHTFTSSGTLSVVKPGTVEYLIVAGGGGGGGYAAGAGGGAGGFRWETNYYITTGNKTVTVGAGGAGANVGVSDSTSGNNSVFDSITSNGGGYGGAGWAGQQGGNGGSGGGGGGYDGTQGTFTIAGGTGSAGQGYNGGVGRGISGNRGAGGGGGGAGAQGGDSTTNSGGNGGNGRQISINGTATYYAGGGGGGDYGSANGGQGGLGGGGNVSGGNGSGIPGGNGTVNTGGGGGGSRSASPDSWNGGNGGSGIVIIRYPIG